MKVQEIERTPLVGEFNTNVFVFAGDKTALMRIPRRNDSMFASLIHEYRALGFIADGGRVKRRTIGEQYVFSRQAAMGGLRVVPPLSFDSKTIIYSFLPDAKTLDVFMQHANEKDRSRIIHQLVHDLYTAHAKDIVYGDRWSGNMLVDPTFGLMHIDFDIELLGPHAHELEVAQTIYHTLWAGGLGIGPALVRELTSDYDGWFELPHITRYLRGFARYLNQTKVGGLEDETEILINTLWAQATT